MASQIEPANAKTNIVPRNLLGQNRNSGTSYESISMIPKLNQKTSLKWKVRKLLGIPTTKSSKKNINMSSLVIIYSITLVSEASRGLLMPSSWPYFESVGGTKQLLGLFVGILSLGRMLISIPLGYFSDKCSSENVFYITGCLQIIGHLLYISCPSVPSLILARFIVGLGSSTISVCRAYIARVVEKKNRTHHYAYLSALQFIGFSVLPGFGTLLSYLPEKYLLGIHFNGYTYPAFVLAIACIITMIATYLFYEDPKNANEDLNEPQQEMQLESDKNKYKKASYLPLVVCLITNMVFRGSIAELETITSPFLMEEFNLSYGQTGIYITLFGIIGLSIYIFFKPLSIRCSDRILMLMGICATFIGSIPLSIPMIAERLPLVLYVTCIGTLWAIAYPIGQTGGLSLFSKVLRGLPPGSLLGIFSATGSAARIIFAILAGELWGVFGRTYVFTSIVTTSIIALGLIIFSWSELF